MVSKKPKGDESKDWELNNTASCENILQVKHELQNVENKWSLLALLLE